VSRVRVALQVGLLLVVLASSTPAAGAQGSVDASERRVLVLAVPGLTWADVDDPALPNLRALLDQSAIANLATRVTNTIAAPAEAYLTIGAGTRAEALPELGGLAYDGAEAFGAGPAGDEHARQQGGKPGSGIVVASWQILAGSNVDSEFGGEVGTLGQALADASIARGVVANADGIDPLLPDEPPHREAALALADTTGAVDCGSVSEAILEANSASPFGVRLDSDAVEAEVARCSTAGSVVLVEASDLRRAAAVRPRLTPERADAAWASALESTDRLVGSLVDRLDPRRDAVVVVAPTTSPDPGLGVFAIRAGEHPAGLLSSGNTRRPGYVVLTDVAPSIAALAGVTLDVGGIEGRPVESHPGHGSAVERRDTLVRGEAAARFRDGMVDPVVLFLVVAASLLALASAAVFLRGSTGAEPWLARAALVLLCFPAMTYLAALFPFHDWGGAAYWLFLLGTSVGAGAGAAAVARRSWLLPVVFACALLLGVITCSVVLLDSRLQLSTVLGDSPIVAGRFTGINNVTFGLFLAAGIVLACVVVHRVAGAKGRRLMLVLLAAVLLIDVAPMWGADVGGALAGVPALAILAVHLGRWRIRWRTVCFIALGTLVLVAALAVLDLSRDSADRSHLGRLFERIGNDGSSGLTTVVERKLGANLRSLTQSTWRFVFAPVALAAALVAWRARSRAVAVARAFPPMVAAGPGVAVAALAGYGLNDSGIAVPGAMIVFLVPVLVYLASQTTRGGPVPERTEP
jgi:hypothetical protein